MVEVRVRVLGGLRVEADGVDARPRGRKAGALLGVLALAPGGVERDRLADLLWSDRGEEQARGSLRHALAELRAGPLGAAGAVAIGRERAMLGERVDVDVAGIMAAVAAGDVAALAGRMAAVEGAPLAGFDGLSPGFDQWLRIERERGCERIVGAVLALSGPLLKEARPGDLQAILRGLDALDPANEVVARLGMTADARDGDLAGLHRRYRRLADDLRREFGARPGEETRALFARLTAGAGPAAPDRGGTGPLSHPFSHQEHAVGGREGERAGAAPARAGQSAARTAPVVMVSPIAAPGGSRAAADIAGIATDDIRVALGRQSDVRVAMLDGPDALDLDRVERACGGALAAYLLSGHLRELDGDTRVTLQLGNLRSRVVAWSGQVHVDRAKVSDAAERIVAAAAGAVVPAIDRDLSAQLRADGMTGGGASERDAAALYARGRRLVRASGSPDAVREGMALLEEAIARDPAHVGARLLLAQLHNTDLFGLVAGHDVDAWRARALALVQEAAALDPGNARIGMKLAWCYLRRHEWDACERRLAAALDAAPYDADAVNEGALAVLQLGDLDRAEALMRRAFALNPFPPADYHADYAMCLAMRGDPTGAEEHFEASGEPRLQYAAARLANLSALPAAAPRRSGLAGEVRARFAAAWSRPHPFATGDLADWLDHTFVFRLPEHRAFWRDRFIAGLGG